MKKKKLSDLAGSWKMNDAEAEELKNNLRKMWGNFYLKSIFKKRSYGIQKINTK